VGAIKLAWWRERLEELDRGVEAPAEPRLRAVANELLNRQVGGEELSRLEDAWLPLLDPFPWGEAQVAAMKLRGRLLFGIGARLLGVRDEEGGRAGAFWSLVDGAHHCSDADSREALLQSARAELGQLTKRLPAALRPLTGLAALAAADLVREGSGLRRLSAAVRHRLSGRLA